MSGVWGNKVKYSIFGESHGKGVGVNIDGLPSGVKLDLDAINFEMERRAPGQDNISTTRSEKDEFEIISGYFNEKTTGTPLCAIIWNTDMQSKDYEELKNIVRPGHADYTGSVKYSGFNDYRGGGHFSGRLTAPLVFAGAIAKQILKEKEIEIGAHIYRIADIYDDPFDKVNINSELLKTISQRKFSVMDHNKGAEMITAIHSAKEKNDSVGGVVECAILNLPEGLGSPFFDSVESLLAHLLFSIPGVKGVEFGTGFDMAELSGSEANDEFYMDEDKVKTFTNHNGGILGGITNGMPVVFKAAFKPTASISRLQKTIDISKRENTVLTVKGRHDPCIVQRALPVVEAAAAMVILELL